MRALTTALSTATGPSWVTGTYGERVHEPLNHARPSYGSCVSLGNGVRVPVVPPRHRKLPPVFQALPPLFSTRRPKAPTRTKEGAGSARRGSSHPPRRAGDTTRTLRERPSPGARSCPASYPSRGKRGRHRAQREPAVPRTDACSQPFETHKLTKK